MAKEETEIINQEPIETTAELKSSDVNAIAMMEGKTPEEVIASFKETLPKVEETITNVEKEVITETPKEKKEPKIKSDNPFLADLNEEVEKQNEIVLEKVEDVYSLLKEDLGIDITTPQQIKEITATYKTLKQQSELYDKDRAEFNEVYETIEALPDFVYGLIDLSIKGKTEAEILSEMKKIVSEYTLPFDHTLPFDKQDLASIMDYLYPNEFTEDDLDDLETPAMKAVIKNAKKEYEALQSKFSQPRKTNYKEQSQEEIKKYKELFEASIQNSISGLSKNENAKFFKPNQISEVAKDMAKGDEFILGLFKDAKGVYKEDAVANLLLLKYGNDAISSLKKFSQNRGESKAVEEILKRETVKPNEQQIEHPKTLLHKLIDDNLNKEQQFKF